MSPPSLVFPLPVVFAPRSPGIPWPALLFTSWPEAASSPLIESTATSLLITTTTNDADLSRKSPGGSSNRVPSTSILKARTQHQSQVCKPVKLASLRANMVPSRAAVLKSDSRRYILHFLGLGPGVKPNSDRVVPSWTTVDNYVPFDEFMESERRSGMSYFKSTIQKWQKRPREAAEGWDGDPIGVIYRDDFLEGLSEAAVCLKECGLFEKVKELDGIIALYKRPKEVAFGKGGDGEAVSDCGDGDCDDDGDGFRETQEYYGEWGTQSQSQQASQELRLKKRKMKEEYDMFSSVKRSRAETLAARIKRDLGEIQGRQIMLTTDTQQGSQENKDMDNLLNEDNDSCDNDVKGSESAVPPAENAAESAPNGDSAIPHERSNEVEESSVPPVDVVRVKQCDTGGTSPVKPTESAFGLEAHTDHHDPNINALTQGGEESCSESSAVPPREDGVLEPEEDDNDECFALTQG